MSDPGERYMLFAAGGRRYAIDVACVDEIAEMLPEYPLPDAPRFVRGVVTIHGKLAAAVDLSLFLGTGPVRQGRNLLLLRLPDAAVALVVERMERIALAEDFLPGEAKGSGAVGVSCSFTDGEAILLSPEELVTSLEKALAAY